VPQMPQAVQSRRASLASARQDRASQAARTRVRSVRSRVWFERHTFRCTFACKHDKVRSAPCFQCGKTFCQGQRPHERTSARVHDGVIANPRPCPKCDFVCAVLPVSSCAATSPLRHTSNRFQCAYGCPHGYSSGQQPRPSTSRRSTATNASATSCWLLALHKDAAKPALPENDTLPHKCELCEWRFPNLAFLAMHIKAKHC
jgi:hypothetical protein